MMYYRLAQALSLVLLSAAVISGVWLSRSNSAVLVLHLVLAGAMVASISRFLSRHWWQRRNAIQHHPNRPRGQLVVISLVLVMLSGAALMVRGEWPLIRLLHLGATITLMIILFWHASWALMRRKLHEWRHPPLVRAVAASSVTMATFASLAWLVAANPAPSNAVRPTATITVGHGALGEARLASAEQCATCHPTVVAEWQQSAHANAVSDTYYQALTALFIEERGVEASRYCASCHNPIGLLQGEIAVDAVIDGPVSEDAYSARSLEQTLAVSHRAAEGVSCAVCHRVVHVPEPARNGALDIGLDPAAELAALWDQIEARAAPTNHRQLFQPALLAEAQLCASCHNLYSPDGSLALEPTYEEWLASPYPGRGQTCQSCHMQRGDQTMVHGGMPGAPSSLPELSANTTLLEQAATLGLHAERNATSINVAVAVTNSGAGHYLPTGADDLRQVWLEVGLFAADNSLLWHSGGLDAYGELLPTVPRFGKVLGDANGRPIALHRFWVATQILSDTRLAPLETRTIPFVITLDSATLASATHIEARLRYRDVSQAFAEFALQRPVPDLPIFEMTHTELTLP